MDHTVLFYGKWPINHTIFVHSFNYEDSNNSYDSFPYKINICFQILNQKNMWNR